VNKTTPFNFHETVIQFSGETWPYIFIGVLTTIIIIIIAFKLRTIINKKCKLDQNCYLNLEFVRGNREIAINIATLKGRPTEYNIVATDFISDVKIIGYCSPQVLFQWHTLSITNRLTGQEIPIDHQVSISFLTKLLLQGIIAFPYQCYPVWVCGNDRFPIHINIAEMIEETPTTITPLI
jgi:hypothetical protein